MSFIAITAKAQHLRKVRKRLRRKGYAAYLPAIVRTRVTAKGSKLKRRRHVSPLMSYVLVEFQADESTAGLTLYDVLETKDVRGYLQSGNGPALIPAHEVEAVRQEVAAMVQTIAAQSHKRWLRSGMKATVKAGSLAGKTGTVQWVRGKRAGLEARLFGAARVVEVQTADLEAA